MYFFVFLVPEYRYCILVHCLVKIDFLRYFQLFFSIMKFYTVVGSFLFYINHEVIKKIKCITKYHWNAGCSHRYVFIHLYGSLGMYSYIKKINIPRLPHVQARPQYSYETSIGATAPVGS